MASKASIVVETAERIFARMASPQAVVHAGDDAWKQRTWQALTESGLTTCWATERHGGVGLGLDEGFAVLRSAGRFAISVPLAETMLSSWFLAAGGIDVPEGAVALGCGTQDDTVRLGGDGRISGRLRGVPFAGETAHLAIPATSRDSTSICLVAAADCQISATESLSGDPVGDVSLIDVMPLATGALPDKIDGGCALLLGAAARSQQIAGALEAMLDQSISYAMERSAFERKISRYQAVQHNLARLGAEATAALSAAVSAADALASEDWNGDAALLEVAAAKVRCGEAAEQAAAIAHQVHGAIGFTAEHVLHRFSLRALAWRDDFGNESYWALKLGRLVSAMGPDALWPLVSSR